MCVCLCVCGVVFIHPTFSLHPALSLSRAGSGTALLQLNETDEGI